MEKIRKNLDVMILNLKKEGEEAMIRGKYRNAFFRLKRETDAMIGDYIEAAIGKEVLATDFKEKGAGYTALCTIVVYLNTYLGKAVVKERNADLAVMLIESAKDEYFRLKRKYS